MDFSLEATDILLTGSMDPLAAQAMVWGMWAIFWWIAIVRTIFYIAIIILTIIAMWKIFEKAWKPWRWSIIPFYNLYLMFQIWWRPWLWFLRILFPPVFAILMIILRFDRAKRFNKHRAFWLWLRLVNIVFLCLLAFDKSIVYTAKK